ncbi:hypothetical protein MNBD_ALPHA09-659 [hydrothermal vent metagenome]|uniref:BPL/LPL catalytic domain-containing protein n=1 Tax=hydrothermal vent metagenome TaxID=652676 RepID=A0A3B0TNR1_9ZZZZ
MPIARRGPEPDVLRFAVTGSTNADALRQARKGRAADAWFVAEEQNGGRGRHGRHWTSARGGLYATRLLVLDLPLQNLVGLTLVAGIAVYDTAASHLAGKSEPGLMLKWPNDLLANGAKLAGILIETESLGARGTAIAIGVGLNVANPLSGDAAKATSLSLLGGTKDVGAVFSTLGHALAEQLMVWDASRGFAAVAAAWERRAMAVGTPTQVRLPNGAIKGTYAGLDSTGGLRLRLASGAIRAIHAGEITLAPVERRTRSQP